MWGWKFLFRARLEKCAAWGFFLGGDALFSARLSFVSWSVRAQHVRGTCASWWDVWECFCFVRVWRNVRRGDFLGNALFSARLSFVYWSVRARHVRGTCASWWDGGGKFLFRARLEKCVMWGFFLGGRIVQRAFIVVYCGVRAQHVRGTCASWLDVGRGVFVSCAFGGMCDVRIFFGGGRIVQRAFVVCLLERARAARAWHVCVLVGCGEGSFCFVRVWRNV